MPTLFVLSISAVGGWKGPGQAHEAPVYDFDQSKLISECLQKADEVSRSACCRLGIVAGPVEQRLDMWTGMTHLGALLKIFPPGDRIDWMPAAKFSKILLEILASASHNSNEDDFLTLTEEREEALTSYTKTYYVVNL
ncbi:hypothetical protein MGN70_009712 [Eutypa lata]|nr:hypothetical protein MGN70_009712 [Eutypa lata]